MSFRQSFLFGFFVCFFFWTKMEERHNGGGCSNGRPNANNKHVAILRRRQTFSSAHRLHCNKLSDEENKEIFGKCNNPNGHGHNYTLEVSLKGEVDKETGMVFNLTYFKEILLHHVINNLDHKNLDLDVEYFKDRVSTTENLAIYIWESLQAALPKGLLYEVKLKETENNTIIYRGETL